MHYVAELALWILAMFFIGCVIGSFAHQVLKKDGAE